jgi:hypothetical protein
MVRRDQQENDMTATGLQLLISEQRGVYIPQHFAQDFNLKAFGIAEDDADIALLSCTNRST